MASNKKTTTPRKPRQTTSHKASAKASSRKTTPRKKKKVAKKWEVPVWMYYALMALMTIVFIAVFYYFFIRPYAYRWKPCYGMKAYGVCLPAGYRVHGIDNDPYHLVLLCENETGYKNLIYMVSKGFTEGFCFRRKTNVAISQCFRNKSSAI